MRINIIISDGNQKENDDFGITTDIATKIHNAFAGNKDYVDSAVLLNFEPAGPAAHQCPDESSINMIFALNECSDKERALSLLSKAIEEIIDNLSLDEKEHDNMEKVED